MKTVAIIFLLIPALNSQAQGNFAAPSWKKIIGQEFSKDTDIPGISGYQPRGGTMITDIDDPEPLSVSWFSKPTSILVLFLITPPNQGFTIIDVLEIKNTTGNQEIKAGDCRDGESDNAGIVALVQTSEAKRFKAIKAWNFNRDKKRIEQWSAQKVTCLGMVGED